MKYGAKTRSGDAVSSFGQRATAAKQFNEEVFTAPGTWTKPNNVDYVDVYVIGGGGGMRGAPILTGQGGAGRVNYEFGVPVSGPVPITVGAGGTSATWTPGPLVIVPHSAGGESAFGPTASPIPATTVRAGGGGSGGSSIPTAVQPANPAANVTAAFRGQDAPPIGGGGGGGVLVPTTVSPTRQYRGGIGYFGYPGMTGKVAAPVTPSVTASDRGGAGGGLRSMYGQTYIGPNNAMQTGWSNDGVVGLFGFGNVENDGPNSLFSVGGSSKPTPTTPTLQNWGSARWDAAGRPGAVIVQWWE